MFQAIVASDERLLIHPYVITEAVSLIQRRLGFQAASACLDTVPQFEMHWVTDEEHHEVRQLFL